jgi:peptide deformylase
MILPILKITGEDRNPLVILRQTCVDVKDFNEDLGKLVSDIVETMFASNGVGLSAPQIGRSLNLFVMRTHDGIRNNTREVRVVINPAVGDKDKDQDDSKGLRTVWTGAPSRSSSLNDTFEGCLSVPDILGRVTRFHEVACAYWDESGQRHEESLKGMQGRMYQHERDHLHGILFVDRADRFYRPES